MTLAADDIAHWQSWTGRSESRSERLDPEALRRFAAAIGEPLDVQSHFPSLGHWGCFLPVAEDDGIGPDGHPKRGGFLPPVSLPRRMFAAGELRFEADLIPGEEATRQSRILDVTHKSGRSGELILVEVEHAIAQQGMNRIVERQTIVYREAGATTPPVIAAEGIGRDADILWQPNAVHLFRFSAVTFNSHRIHYDLPYATGEEQYPGLVVHGPFTAARLFGLAREAGRLSRFTFRAQAPIFAGQPVRLRKSAEGVEAIRADGATAMAATFEYYP
ncbi:MaoC family dehydratase N-terminal domain-containing protein [Sandaracinobacter sp. RS1-74]|uniref:FAS1-like dehydratase domain-containing protein n=1 Tax=Sandaracinobacteroides sayramensis TaxID=2913411 RepID=UPI001EDB738F|nr:MaoC family dehydratase N-terminal domain-containing protein [Sandaracinobacteroides sayramensis]MCG2841107.1 MaoC family dehydratase N-terminal domain-containing protein [Sandaracinobacteroides sayramensis]